MAEKRTSTISRKLATAGAVLVACTAVLGLGGAYLAAHPGRGVFCTAAGSIGGPVSDDPEQAFDAWWAEFHPDTPQDRGDIDRDGTTWHIDKGKPGWRKVEVSRAKDSFDGKDDGSKDPDGWTVTGANSCSYA